MSRKQYAIGLLFKMLTVLCIIQGWSIVISTLLFAKGLCMRDYALIGITLVFLCFFAKGCNRISNNRPEMSSIDDVHAYYKDVPQIYPDTERKPLLYAYLLLSWTGWQCSAFLSLTMLNGAVGYFEELFGNRYGVVNLYAAPSFITIEGVWAAYCLSADSSIDLAAPAEIIPVRIILIVATFLCISLAAVAWHEISVLSAYNKLLEEFEKGGQHDNQILSR